MSINVASSYMMDMCIKGPMGHMAIATTCSYHMCMYMHVNQFA